LFFDSAATFVDKAGLKGWMPGFSNTGSVLPLALHGKKEPFDRLTLNNVLILPLYLDVSNVDTEANISCIPDT
jgi:hypothetical protein